MAQLSVFEEMDLQADDKNLSPFIQKWEGGFANDPSDRGGATMAGVTLSTYSHYCKIKRKRHPSVSDLKNISQEEWQDIFKTLYWDRWQADKIKSQRVANILVDWVWASGVYGIKIPQSMLHVKPDGMVGVKTLEAVNKAGEAFAPALIEERIKFVERICILRPQNNKFKKGWIRRIKAL